MADLVVYDPTGTVDVENRPLAPRPTAIAGLRLGVLDNGKWNAGRLLDRVVELLPEIGEVRRYRKESFSRNAPPELLAEMAEENDLGLLAIGD